VCLFEQRRFSSSTSKGTGTSTSSTSATTTPTEDAQAAKVAAETRLADGGISTSFMENALSKDAEAFKVTQVKYNGRLSTIYLPPADILKRTSILPRDLVSLHLTSREERYNGNSRRRGFVRPPTAILPRTDCILLSFGNIRAVAGRDSVYVLDAHTQTSKSFAKDLAAIFTTDTTGDPPELLFLEAVLRDTVDTFTRRIRLFEPIVDDFLTRVANEVFSDAGVHQLVPLKDSLQSFELQVLQSLECLTSLLNDDELMLDLLLTEQAEARQKGTEVDFERHEYVELMLSVYSRQIQTMMQEIQYLLGRLQSKQEFVALALAGYRNRLVRMNVNLGIIAVSTGITTAMTGLFGMNLISGLEESPVAFAVVAAGATTTAVVVAGVYFSFIRGRNMQERAEERLAEIETLTSALSDMCALDYTVKKMMTQGHLQMDKQEFKRKLMQARLTQKVSDKEVDLLFDVLDTQKDNHLTSEDFSTKGKK
jgi:Mg2+ and Co2+ transporter CorA